MKHLMRFVLLIAVAMILSSCSDNITDNLTQPDNTAVNKDDVLNPGELSPEEAEGIIYMRQEEKLARDVYTVLGQTWNLRIFENIKTAEQKHMDAVKMLIDRYSLVDPIISDEVGVFQDPAFQQMFEDFVTQGQLSIPEAFTSAQNLELQDIAALDGQLVFVDNPDIVKVYTNLKAASIKHYNAFLNHITPFTF